MITGMIDQVTRSYRLTARHLLALPFVFALPVLAEALQHLVEFWLGMFVSGDGIEPGRESMVRMGFGGVKVIAILFTMIVMARYFLHDFNQAKALHFSQTSRSAIVISVLFTIALAIILTFSGPSIVALAKDHLPFIPPSVRRFLPILVLLAATHPFQKKTFAIMSEILDDTPLGAASSEVASSAWMRDSWLTLLVAVAPAMVLHYYLNSRAVDAPPSIQLLLLALDCAVVGIMAVLIAAATFCTYQGAKRVGAECETSV